MAKNKLLYISYQFPPFAGSGVYRLLNFIERFPIEGWDPLILTVQPDNYEKETLVDPCLEKRVDSSVRVYRTKCFQGIERLLSFRSVFRARLGIVDNSLNSTEYTGYNQLDTRNKGLWQFVKDAITLMYRIPDKYIGWLPFAVKTGFHICRHDKPRLIFASGAPWTSFLIGLALKKHFKIPLVIDFRDPWMGNPYNDLNVGLRKRINGILESRCIMHADAVIANTEPLRKLLIHKYRCKDKIFTVTNGYNEAEYSHLDCVTPSNERIVFCHVGTLYSKRSPESFLVALSNLINRGIIKSCEVEVHFIGHFNGSNLHDIIDAHSLGPMVKVLGIFPKERALEMLFHADVALLIQPDTNLQIPAKLFEYMRSRKPILAVCGEGATKELIESHDLGVVGISDDTASIEEAILCVIDRARLKDNVSNPDSQMFEVGALTKQLTTIFHGVLN